MTYHIDYSLSNGLGKPAISLYLKGCDVPNKCKGCHNQEYQKPSIKHNLSKIKQSLDEYINNFKEFHNKLYVCFLGGEPLTKYNREITLEISKYVKEKYNAINIIYTWRELNQINNKYIKFIDYGVLGKFQKESKIDKILPSSTNQYIYDFNNQTKLKPIKLK